MFAKNGILAKHKFRKRHRIVGRQSPLAKHRKEEPCWRPKTRNIGLFFSRLCNKGIAHLEKLSNRRMAIK